MKHTASGTFTRLSDIELRQLQVFKRVVECGSFNVAEIELNISRSHISSRITSLEDRLGIKLLERGRGRAGFHLTPQGERVFHSIDTLFGNIDQFSQDITTIKSEYQGVLRIAVPDDLLYISEYSAVHEAIAAVTATTPNVRVELLAHAIDEVELDVRQGRVDVCIGSVFYHREDLDYTQLPDFHCYLYCSDKHPLYSIPDNELEADSIESQNLAGAGYNLNPTVAAIYARFPQTGIANHMSARLFMALTGRYLVFLPDYFAKPYIESGELRQILPGEYSYVVQNAVFSHKKARQNALVKGFVKELNARLNPQ